MHRSVGVLWMYGTVGVLWMYCNVGVPVDVVYLRGTCGCTVL
jgi:hypothetical protein